MKVTSVLFVCLGNICRSPAGEGILKKISKEQSLSLRIESAGVGGWHAGEPPDPRMREHAHLRGYELNSKAQKLNSDFINNFDLILMADKDLYDGVSSKYDNKSKIKMMTFLSKKYKKSRRT